MKDLSKFMSERLDEARLEDYYMLGSDENGDHILTICDVNGDRIEFDPKVIEKFIKQAKDFRKEKFIELVFAEFPEADTINNEISWNNEEPEVYEYVLRGEEAKGWQKERGQHNWKY